MWSWCSIRVKIQITEGPSGRVLSLFMGRLLSGETGGRQMIMNVTLCVTRDQGKVNVTDVLIKTFSFLGFQLGRGDEKRDNNSENQNQKEKPCNSCTARIHDEDNLSYFNDYVEVFD